MPNAFPLYVRRNRHRPQQCAVSVYLQGRDSHNATILASNQCRIEVLLEPCKRQMVLFNDAEDVGLVVTTCTVDLDVHSNDCIPTAKFSTPIKRLLRLSSR